MCCVYSRNWVDEEDSVPALTQVWNDSFVACFSGESARSATRWKKRSWKQSIRTAYLRYSDDAEYLGVQRLFGLRPTWQQIFCPGCPRGVRRKVRRAYYCAASCRYLQQTATYLPVGIEPSSTIVYRYVQDHGW